jgi:hypothetical protein
MAQGAVPQDLVRWLEDLKPRFKDALEENAKVRPSSPCQLVSVCVIVRVWKLFVLLHVFRCLHSLSMTGAERDQRAAASSGCKVPTRGALLHPWPSHTCSCAHRIQD